MAVTRSPGLAAALLIICSAQEHSHRMLLNPTMRPVSMLTLGCASKMLCHILHNSRSVLLLSSG